MILATLYTLGSATAREIHAHASGPTSRVYTTTAKVLDRLFAKGLVSRKRRERVWLYRPRVRRAAVEKHRARRLVGQLLGSDPQPPLAALVDAVAQYDPQLLDQLEAAVAAHRRSRRGP